MIRIPLRATRLALAALLAVSCLSAQEVQHRLLATSKTSTMEKEMNDAARAGFRAAAFMGGETAFGGTEAVTVMARTGGKDEGRYEYRLLAASKTSTIEKELREAGQAGFRFVGQTIFQSTFGGREVAVILEKDRSQPNARYDFCVQATSKTSTLEKEMQQRGQEGFRVLAMTVAQTAFGGKEVLAIMGKSTGETAASGL